MKVFFMALLFASSVVAVAEPTQEIPNVRTLLKLEKKRLHRRAWKRSMTPLPVVSMVFSGRAWKDYHHARKLYKYFTAAVIIKHPSRYKKSSVEDAREELQDFLNDIKEELKEQVESEPKNMLAKGQKTITEKVLSMNVKDLGHLLRKTDRIIPLVLGDSKLYFINPDLSNFIYNIYTVDNPDAKKPLSILEASIKKEKLFIKSGLLRCE